jgi:hypothetical protein
MMITWYIFEEFDKAAFDAIRRQVVLIGTRVLEWTDSCNVIGNLEEQARIRILRENLSKELQSFVGSSFRLHLPNEFDEWERRDSSFDSFVKVINIIKEIRDICVTNFPEDECDIIIPKPNKKKKKKDK